jgi:hypothetical protein
MITEASKRTNLYIIILTSRNIFNSIDILCTIFIIITTILSALVYKLKAVPEMIIMA